MLRLVTTMSDTISRGKSNALETLKAPLSEQETIVLSAAPSPHDDGYATPTGEELESLRRVAGSVKWTAYTIAFVELCERFSYYGTTAVCM